MRERTGQEALVRRFEDKLPACSITGQLGPAPSVRRRLPAVATASLLSVGVDGFVRCQPEGCGGPDQHACCGSSVVSSARNSGTVRNASRRTSPSSPSCRGCAPAATCSAEACWSAACMPDVTTSEHSHADPPARAARSRRPGAARPRGRRRPRARALRRAAHGRRGGRRRDLHRAPRRYRPGGRADRVRPPRRHAHGRRPHGPARRAAGRTRPDRHTSAHRELHGDAAGVCGGGRAPGDHHHLLGPARGGQRVGPRRRALGGGGLARVAAAGSGAGALVGSVRAWAGARGCQLRCGGDGRDAPLAGRRGRGRGHGHARRPRRLRTYARHRGRGARIRKTRVRPRARPRPRRPRGLRRRRDRE